ncbi:TPA: hypothetical protein DEP21_04025 [Patescibacteria group bacterium]|nr:hypothetical protein [Candidatus Gracilibacteria bacterium]
MVFSTIHTNSAAETITRVFNLGAKAYMLAGTFNVVMAERLARKVCSHCKQQVSVKEDPKYAYAISAFKNYNLELLKKEVLDRGITQEQWKSFMEQ